MEIIELRGDRVVDAPESPGLYAWYYRPIRPKKEDVVETWARLLSVQPKISTRISHRYGVSYTSEGVGRVEVGAEENSIYSLVNDAFDAAPNYFLSLFESSQFVYFCRPIYIGIAKNLRERIYSQHYVSLIDYWSEGSRVGRFLKSHDKANVQIVMEALELPHSFALEARVMGISPRDLIASVFPTDNLPDSIGSDSDSGSGSSTRRALERVLQLLADPVCGRR